MERIHAVTFAPFLFIAGCEMVQTERREAEWRKVIAAIRRKYDRPVSYNTDKYQEHNVKWWDAVDKNRYDRRRNYTNRTSGK